MYLEIIAPDKIFFKGEAEKISVPGMLGQFAILNGHAAIVSILKKGRIIYFVDNEEKHFDIISGIVEVKANNVIVCVDKRNEASQL